ncbi:MAG: tRNA 5-methoxyuridine(34)/uridine 5-oxyacetic acid(34) synthase CmoB [Mariprofundaceae bacterium]|nr:tRNA 5-methoxyuridine(34)/uridine 5-oxyacetic acid(34) synthase CmoB [Mariprofundaceae bacterium]
MNAEIAKDSEKTKGFELKTYQRAAAQQLSTLLPTYGMEQYQGQLMDAFAVGWQKIFKHGDLPRWQAGLEALPDVFVDDVACEHEVRIADAKASNMSSQAVEQALKAMHPWRKGPFEVFGVHIDTEWRSDWKWQRLQQHIQPLKGRIVLDIGCGSGYHMWRMWGQKADLVLGIDPTPLFSLHFATIKRYLPTAPVCLLPTGIDEMPENMASFDTVFSMGILYHRREPLEHLFKIKGLLQKGGELVLETLVVDGDEHTCLMPSGRYAKMRNVWFIPSVKMLTIWLQRAGFSNIRCVDVCSTSIEEQRPTDWMQFESLPHFLDPDDASKTIEGYAAPKRAVMLANVS